MYVHFLELSLASIQFEILTPSAQRLVQFRDRLEERTAPGSSEDATQFCSESFEPAWMHQRLTCGAHEGIPEKFRLSRAKDAALATVYPQLERLLDEFDRVFQYTFPCTFRLHVDIAVVRVSAELQTPLFQIPVQFV